MAETQGPVRGLDPYMDWVKKEGLPISEDYGIDLFKVPVKPWARVEANAAAVHLKARGEFTNMLLFELPPGRATAPQRHLYEEVVYVLEGSGSSEIEYADGRKRSFEWGVHSMFAIPLNTRYRHFNGSGRERALIVSTTNLPLLMNTFHHEDFIFNLAYDFDRAGKSEYFDGSGDLHTGRPGSYLWETNFVPDLEKIELKAWEERGAGSLNLMFVLADGQMHAHLSEMPVGTYKKAHRHGPGFHVMCVRGTGFSLLWFEGDQDYRRIDWKHGMVFPPADRQFHQHFNTSDRPARYLATGVGSVRYPLMDWQRRAGGESEGDKQGAVATSTKDGGDQIEYADQDPRIHAMWLTDMRKNGVPQKMDRYFPQAAE
jgi:mannose-6-phosphate isomerase-like protein (cupin superfamily)